MIGIGKARRTVYDQLAVDKETKISNKRSNTSNDESPGGASKRLGKLKESVCSSFSRYKKSNQKAWRVQAPIPRPCVHCRMVIGSRALMRRHIQEEHRDILLMKKRSMEDSERKMLSTDEFEPGVCPPESAKPTHGKGRFAEPLEKMKMESFGQTEQDSRTLSDSDDFWASTQVSYL